MRWQGSYLAEAFRTAPPGPRAISRQGVFCRGPVPSLPDLRAWSPIGSCDTKGICPQFSQSGAVLSTPSARSSASSGAGCELLPPPAPPRGQGLVPRVQGPPALNPARHVPTLSQPGPRALESPTHDPRLPKPTLKCFLRRGETGQTEKGLMPSPSPTPPTSATRLAFQGEFHRPATSLHPWPHPQPFCTII